LIDGDTDGDRLTDTALLRGHVEGGPGAFAVLVARHQDRLWAIALHTVRNAEDAADACKTPTSQRSGGLAVTEAGLR